GAYGLVGWPDRGRLGAAPQRGDRVPPAGRRRRRGRGGGDGRGGTAPGLARRGPGHSALPHPPGTRTVRRLRTAPLAGARPAGASVPRCLGVGLDLGGVRPDFLCLAPPPLLPLPP